MDSKIELQEIFDLEIWQKIQESFAHSTGYAAIIVNKEGYPILDYSNFCEYCMELRESSNCRSCYNSDAQGGKLASIEKKPIIYQCHGKLIDFAVPIMVQGEYVGAILAGQTRLYPGEESLVGSEIITDISESLDEEKALLATDKMQELYQKTMMTHYEQIKAASELLYTLANYLAEMRMVNLMQEELHQKEIELSESNRLKSEIETALKLADLQALQAQVNPHFLFNVLNTIGRLAMFEGAEQTEELVFQFADLMRYTLSRSDSNTVTIQDELDHVEHYLRIQKFRLEDRLAYEFHSDPSALNVVCPSMIIQPFVENAINHVVEPRIKGGFIEISALDKGNEVEIIIEDNGSGIPQEKVKEILNGTHEPKGASTGLGINNVNKRLVHYYGTEYGVRIEQAESKGTKVTIRIPKMHSLEA